MKKIFLIIAHNDIETVGLATSQIIASHNLQNDVQVIDLNKFSHEETLKILHEIYPEEKQAPFKFKCYKPMAECFIEKPKKPRYNPKTCKVKYFYFFNQLTTKK
jgi:hypothetical protein